MFESALTHYIHTITEKKYFSFWARSVRKWAYVNFQQTQYSLPQCFKKSHLSSVCLHSLLDLTHLYLMPPKTQVGRDNKQPNLCTLSPSLTIWQTSRISSSICSFQIESQFSLDISLSIYLMTTLSPNFSHPACFWADRTQTTHATQDIGEQWT